MVCPPGARPVLLGRPCQKGGDVSRPRTRGTFGTAQKYPKGRLGAAAPKYPIDVQFGAYSWFRRAGIVLPLPLLPGLRPCLGRCPSRISPIPRLSWRSRGSVLHRTMDCERKREATASCPSGLPFHRPAGALGQAPGGVGTHSTDTSAKEYAPRP